MTREEKYQLQFFENQELPEGKMSSYFKIKEELEQLKQVGLDETLAFCSTLWSSIDLMARFHSGQLVNRNSTSRLSRYLRGPMEVSSRQCDNYLLFRHACMHGMGLYAFDPSGKRELRFTITQSAPSSLHQVTASHFQVNPEKLYARFLKSVENYRTSLEQDEELLKKFAKVHRKLGYLTDYRHS